MWDASSMWVKGGVVRANMANDAGGILVGGSATLHLVSTNLTNNNAVQSGGALYGQDNGSILATACTIADNTAGADGGGFYAV
jgi:predicted outer membrane repeat protein